MKYLEVEGGGMMNLDGFNDSQIKHLQLFLEDVLLKKTSVLTPSTGIPKEIFGFPLLVDPFAKPGTIRFEKLSLDLNDWIDGKSDRLSVLTDLQALIKSIVNLKVQEERKNCAEIFRKETEGECHLLCGLPLQLGYIYHKILNQNGRE